MSVITYNMTIREWLAAYSKDEIAVFIEDMLTKKDAEIERLNAQVKWLRSELDARDGELENAGQRWVIDVSQTTKKD